MDCNEVEKKLQLFIDGELYVEDMEEIWEHLVRCQCCEGHYESDVLLKQALKEKLIRTPANTSILEQVKEMVLHAEV